MRAARVCCASTLIPNPELAIYYDCAARSSDGGWNLVLLGVKRDVPSFIKIVVGVAME